MNNVSYDSLDEIYQDVRKAFEEKLEALVTKLKGSIQYDELITMREKAYEVIEEFKTIEEELPERIVDESHPDNFRLLQEFNDVNGIIVPKPYIYKKTYAEARASIQKEMFDGRISGIIKLVDENFWLHYLFMGFKDFYWSEYILSNGNKKDSCEFLLYALLYIIYAANRNDEAKTGDWLELNKRFVGIKGKSASSLGGKKKLKDLDYLKPYISSALSDHSPEGGWESKRQFIDTIIPLVVKLDGEHNSEKWKEDPIKRENTLRNRIDKWLLDDQRDNYDKFIRNKNKR